MNDRRKFRFLLTLVFLHATLVILGAAEIHWDARGALGKALSLYAVVSGAERSFGFFAPSVNTQTRATFAITDKNGRQMTRSLEDGQSSEVALRLGEMGARFWGALNENHDTLRRAMAESWAGRMFVLYPEAQEIVVSFEVFRLISMEAYRLGSRPRWIKIYEARYARQS